MRSKVNIGLVVSNCNDYGGASSYESEIINCISTESEFWSLTVIHTGCCKKFQSESRYKNLNFKKANKIQQRLKSLARTSLMFNLILFKIGIKQTNFEKFLIKNQIDIVYFTSPNHLALQLLSLPMINTVWDLGHLEKFKFFETNLKGNYEIRELYYNKILRRSMYIIVDSETTKQNIISYYGLPNTKIITIGFPLKKFEFKKEYKFHDLPEEFFFYPSSFWTHKAHNLLLEACAKLKHLGIECNFVFAGQDKGNLNKIKKNIEIKKLDRNVKIYQNLSDNEIGYLLNKSICVVFPSLIGPTNLPPLEALSMGKPVIVSSVHSELSSSDIIIKLEKDSEENWERVLNNFIINFKSSSDTSDKITNNIMDINAKVTLELNTFLHNIVEEIRVVKLV